jgi:hypothetical protein
MEEKNVRYIVMVIIGTILFALAIIITILVDAVKRDNKPVTTTKKHEYSTINCYHEEKSGTVSKKDDMTITYDYEDLDKLVIKYTYLTKNDVDFNDAYVELNTLGKSERDNHAGVDSQFKQINGGVELTLTYDLKESNLRIHTNSKYFNGNIYQKSDDLIHYLENNNYVCATRLV